MENKIYKATQSSSTGRMLPGDQRWAALNIEMPIIVTWHIRDDGSLSVDAINAPD